MDEFTWLRHPETGGYFHCPPDAVKAWLARGWELADAPPAEPDKTRDEPMLAALREAQLAEQAPAQPPADAPAGAENPNPAKTSRTPRAAATDAKE